MNGAGEGKRAAARAALAEVRSGMDLGLGTGSTVRFFLEALSDALRTGALTGVRGVPTSQDTEEACRLLDIPLLALHEADGLELAVDGADEVSPELDLVKGLGGALAREKIVAQEARRFVVVVDAGKEVEALGEKAPVPVEVLPFGWPVHLRFLRATGGEPVPREGADGELFVTDNGNHVIDLHFSPRIPDPQALDRALRRRAGIVESGLFLGTADRVLVGAAGGVEVRDRRGR